MTSPSNSKKPDGSLPTVQHDQSNINHTDSKNDPSTTYECHIAHATEIKFINDRYITPVTVKFGSSESDNAVSLPAKHRKLFAALKCFDPSLSITINDTTLNHPGESPMGIAYTENFDVIVDKKPRYPHFSSITTSIPKSNSPP